jgi:ATP-dependent DNA helicase RecG
MAPTEVLAEQHAATVIALLDGVTVPAPESLFQDRPLRVALLTNRVTGQERRDTLAGLADGTVDVVIGTHALIQEGVRFSSLGAVVIDEQHRFGVEQRAALRAKGEEGDAGTVPDVLVMTATPIPRTAAMTVYGDLDVSTITSKPAGRQPIVTTWANGPLMEEAVWAHVRVEVAEGRQAYVVCPLIEESDKLEVASAEETFARLSSGDLAGLQLGLLHGRLPVGGEGGDHGPVPGRRARCPRGHDGDRGRRRRPQRHDDGHPRRRTASASPSSTSSGAASAGGARRRRASW